jgi:hypothetical protein|tara:strand:+ start:257 stop:520 length:264 start_codon:yes stop_codon:yes gene_type:complete
MSRWQDFLKARYYDGAMQTNPQLIAQQLRQDFSKAPSLHKALSNFIPIIEEYALKDKARASRYRQVAENLRKVTGDIKDLIVEYERS